MKKGMSTKAAKPQGKPATIGQIIDLVVTIIQSIIRDLTGEQVQLLLSSKGKITNGIRKLFREILGEASAVASPDHLDEKAKWTAFYKRHFNLDLDLVGIDIPEKPTEGNWTLIIVADGLTLNQVYGACAKQFTCYRYVNDLDSNIKDIANRPNNTYAVWVEADVEAPAKHANKSADDLLAENHNGITLKERMLLELSYFEETGKHLDLSNWTLCSGSRYSDGFVPCAFWDGGDGFSVGWTGRDDRFPYLRSRLVVS